MLSDNEKQNVKHYLTVKKLNAFFKKRKVIVENAV